ncbi:MAG: SDR family NAD(P)-dependent oxidoreductase [Roseiflexaceae bacterium]|nr:SDR family NAD(P)-dependent oxidoreductase [Roseiflexaceae bacterium]
MHKTILITGANRGLGFAAAQALARAGHQLVMTSRDAARGQAAAERIRAQQPDAQVESINLDLSDLDSVRRFADAFASRYGQLDVLIANAANLPEAREPAYTPGGRELTFATNHLGHFLLAHELLPLMERAAQRSGEARLVVVSSRLHLPRSMGPETRFDFEDLDLRRNYHPMVAYKNSKLANIWFTYEFDRRYGERGVRANALCPGFVPATAAANAKRFQRFMFTQILARMPFARTLESAVATYSYVATDPALRGVGGKFFAEKLIIPSSPESYDKSKASRLWQISEQLVSAERSAVL